MKILKNCIILTILLFFVQSTFGQGAIIMANGVTENQIDNTPRDFYDPGGPASDTDPGYFGQNLRDTLRMRTYAEGTVMYVLFESFVMGPGDTLFIFDGPDCNSPVDTYNLVRSPGEIQASGRWMTFVFHSDDQDIAGLRDGWVAKVYAYEVAPYVITFGGENNSPLTCYAEFYDSGGPNSNILNNNENPSSEPGLEIYQEFTSPVGTHIKCEFTQFSVNGVLKIYDGQYYDNNKRLIGQFCTTTLDVSTNNMPPVLFSTGSTLTFVYKGAANDQNKPGWRALITCVPELFKSEGGNACPSVDNMVDSLYADLLHPGTQGNPDTVLWDCDNPFVMLNASVIATGQYTNDYWVQEIPFEPIFPFNAGELVDADFDDQWLEGVPLGFTFTFFGEDYPTVYPGTNGLVSMTHHNHPTSTYERNCAWAYGVPPASPPYNTTIEGNMGNTYEASMTVPYNYKNCIYGVYEDIDCSVPYNSYSFNTPGGVRKGVLTYGEHCHAFVFNFLNVALYNNHSDPSNYNSYQIVLYEGTNIIDVYVKHRNCCATTNAHEDESPPEYYKEGIIGLQNRTSSQILLVPGREMVTNGDGWIANDEAYRFTPVTPLDEQGELSWYINDTNSVPYSHDKSILISKPDTTVTKYISVYKFTNASHQPFTLIDTTIVLLQVPIVHLHSSEGNNYICPNDSVTLSATFSQYPDILPIKYKWSTGDTTETCGVRPSESTTYTLTVYFDNGCDNSDTFRVKVTELEFPVITGDDTICFGQSTTLTATHPNPDSYKWNTVPPKTDSIITERPQATYDYIVSVTMGPCVVTDTMTVTVMPLPIPSFTASPTEIYVENGIGTVTCTDHSNGDYHLTWNFGDIFSNFNIVEDMSEVTHEYTHSGYYTITLTAEDTLGCIDSTYSRVSVEVPYFFYIPNAFSPDADGINEYFAPQGQGVDPDQYMMQIFDRAGMLIYSTRNPYDYWDGRNKYGQLCPEGVYVYLIRLVNLNKEDKEYTGTVTLIR